ncbi:MAG: dynamin family protein, partial [Oceanospirillaceae bacterium]|nr:dynamin family protein [Oceanospirillaceae bacterium]
MTVSSLKSYQEEATRLLQQLLDLLHNVSHHSALLNDAQTTEQQSFTPSKLASRISILNGEMAKLENLEMVLAIVGTAKAGKSTTINAIVGREIMPNHNRPMTALPTLIRHTPLQKEPQLRFDHIEPISQLLASLRNELKKPEIKELSKELLKGPDDSDMANLLEMIQKHYRFKTRYKGTAAIYEFLQMFNDLVRLADKFGCEFPFAEYSEINQLPVIEVEFAHLAELNQSNGRLTLLDTPGPNEARQSHLRLMLREQLQKASAVLSVMNYTQLGVDADDEMHQELAQVVEMVDRRMFALVNKFD